jgi:hypothetical protein
MYPCLFLNIGIFENSQTVRFFGKNVNFEKSKEFGYLSASTCIGRRLEGEEWRMGILMTKLKPSSSLVVHQLLH